VTRVFSGSRPVTALESRLNMARRGLSTIMAPALAVLLLAAAAGVRAQQAAGGDQAAPAPECDQKQAPGSVTFVRALVVDKSTVDVSCSY
jgi:hypothetical protein